MNLYKVEIRLTGTITKYVLADDPFEAEDMCENTEPWEIDDWDEDFDAYRVNDAQKVQHTRHARVVHPVSTDDVPTLSMAQALVIAGLEEGDLHPIYAAHIAQTVAVVDDLTLPLPGMPDIPVEQPKVEQSDDETV